MKKLLLSAVLGVAVVAITPALSQAGTFGLFTGCGSFCWPFNCCGSSKCNFTVRPYNAFTPVCSGNITCMGAMPFAYPYPNYAALGPVSYGAYPSAPEAHCAPSEVIGQSPMVPPYTVQQTQPDSPSNLPPLPPQYAQPVQPPAPIVPPVTAPTSSMMPNPYGMIQANYRPVYVPTYNPYNYYGYYGQTGTTPYYWNK